MRDQIIKTFRISNSTIIVGFGRRFGKNKRLPMATLTVDYGKEFDNKRTRKLILYSI